MEGKKQDKKRKTICDLQRKVEDLLPKEYNYNIITVEHKGRTLVWSEILYNVVECELKNKDDGHTLLRDHFHMLYFRGRPWRMRDEITDNLTWDKLAIILDRIFEEHFDNLLIWRKKYREILKERKEEYLKKLQNNGR